MSRAACIAALVSVALFFAASARAGNDDGVLVGNEPALTGGAVTAIVSDGTATWYNPAGVSEVDRDTIDVSGSVTMVRIADTPALLRSATGSSADGNYYELLGIPSAVTLVRRIDCRTTLGLGIFVPQLTNHTDRVALDEADAALGYEAHWRLAQQDSSSAYHGGITLAFHVSDTVRVGVTLFGTYRQLATTSEFVGTATTPMGMVGVALAEHLELQSVALSLAAGLQWEIVPGLHLGVAVRGPGLQIAARFQQTSATLIAALDPMGAGTIDLDPMDGEELQPRFGVVAPTRVRAGLAYRWSGGWIGIDGDIQHELSTPDLGVRRRTIGGVRIGGRVQVDPTVSLGGGLFTDLSPEIGVAEFGATMVDYYGGTFGIELRNPHRLGEGENAADLVFINTFALRYAVGVGSVGGLRFDPTREGIVEVVPVGTTIHEIGLHLGSALYF